MESALILHVPEAEAVVRSWRQRYDPAAAAGMPAHVTLIVPFRQIDRITEDVVSVLGSLFARHPPFPLTFTTTRRFPGVVWLAPDDPGPVIALIRALVAAFPDCPPYCGAFSGIVPHLTIADLHREPEADVEIHRLESAFMTEAGSHLPIRSHMGTASLFLKRDGVWSESRTFELGS